MKIGLYLDHVGLQILKNGLFVSCEPKDRIEQISPGLVQQRLAEVGDTYLICDLNQQVQAKAKLAEAFVTYFGDPDTRLLDLLGFSEDSERFRQEYTGFFKQQFPDEVLVDDTELFVTVYRPVTDS